MAVPPRGDFLHQTAAVKAATLADDSGGGAAPLLPPHHIRAPPGSLPPLPTEDTIFPLPPSLHQLPSGISLLPPPSDFINTPTLGVPLQLPHILPPPDSGVAFHQQHYHLSPLPPSLVQLHRPFHPLPTSISDASSASPLSLHLAPPVPPAVPFQPLSSATSQAPIPPKQQPSKKPKQDGDELLYGSSEPKRSVFIEKTFEMVNNPHFQHFVSWSRDRKMFVVHNVVDFSSQVLPTYFKHSNFCSFVRQLNIYGFHKVQSKEGYAFQHEHFHPDDPAALNLIKRKKPSRKTVTSTTESQKNSELYKNVLKHLYEVEQQNAEISNEVREVQDTLDASSTRHSNLHDTITKVADYLCSKMQGDQCSLPVSL